MTGGRKKAQGQENDKWEGMKVSVGRRDTKWSISPGPPTEQRERCKVGAGTMTGKGVNEKFGQGAKRTRLVRPPQRMRLKYGITCLYEIEVQVNLGAVPHSH